jgi:transposase
VAPFREWIALSAVRETAAIHSPDFNPVELWWADLKRIRGIGAVLKGTDQSREAEEGC